VASQSQSQSSRSSSRHISLRAILLSSNQKCSQRSTRSTWPSNFIPKMSRFYRKSDMSRTAMPRMTRSFIRSANAGEIFRHVGRVASHGAFENSLAVPARRRVSGEHHDDHSQQAECMASHMSRAAKSALPEISARHMSMILLPPKQVAKCRGVQLLKEQNIRSKHMRHNTTQNQQRIFINIAGVGAILVVNGVNGGVARQQQLSDFNVTILGGAMQGSGIAEGTGDQG
jgi:hypothetical protein